MRFSHYKFNPKKRCAIRMTNFKLTSDSELDSVLSSGPVILNSFQDHLISVHDF
ncbi:MAG: hypothetical protein ACI9NN_000801 [Bacteroidia bacterium]|jgi:hypothetical protein